MSALQTVLPSTLTSASVSAKPEPSCMIFADTIERLSGRDEGAQLDLLQGGEERHLLEAGARDQQPARRLRHGFDQQHARHQRAARKMPFENGAVGRERSPQRGSSGH